MWRNIFFITGVPVIGALSINAYTTEMKHLAHQHEPHFKHLPYLHIRQKPFPWRNGDQSLFFNPGSQAGKEE
jgi:cytochrome c oxidase subunit 6a